MVGKEGLGGQLKAQLRLLGAFLGIEARIARRMRRHQNAAVGLVGNNNMLAAHQVLAEGAGGRLNCPIPDVCIDERRLPLFIARATLRDLIAGLEARATCGAAQ